MLSLTQNRLQPLSVRSSDRGLLRKFPRGRLELALGKADIW